jgi:uncharacterized protein (DUF1810 family)
VTFRPERWSSGDLVIDLDRFKRAQDGPGGFATALAELEAGRKRSHWIWYVFPQLAGLGQSSAAIHYGLQGVDEAGAYLKDPQLRDRLLRVTTAVLAQLQRDPAPALVHVMGSEIDALKLISSMTLFREVARRMDDHELAAKADAVLQAARTQGYRECEFTTTVVASAFRRTSG